MPDNNNNTRIPDTLKVFRRPPFLPLKFFVEPPHFRRGPPILNDQSLISYSLSGGQIALNKTHKFYTEAQLEAMFPDVQTGGTWEPK